ncbi:MAG: protease modulator HflC, partial [Mariprofundaceae bacterium]|nr:protease modulator HflC [Mariprofundaceae bacterium]
MNTKQLMAVVIVLGGALLANMCAFVVDQREQVLELQFGNPKVVVNEPGLHFKLPWESLSRFENRL